MTTTVIITVCALLLAAYVFDLTSARTRIPSVILLLLSGWLVRLATELFDVSLPDLTRLLPIFGTIGLILIVLEGSLELELHRSKAPLILKSLVVSLLPMIILAVILAFLFRHFGNASFKNGLVNAIPFCVISSAIAIPSVRNLFSRDREFVIFESSFSDIFGVLLFNFLALNEAIGSHSFGHFIVQFLVMCVVSFVSVIGLSWLLSRLNHHIKFAPIILLVILIYAVSKIYHLPGLIFILVFGLFLGNLDKFVGVRWIEKLRPEKLDKEVHKFRDITAEAAFLVRALFFLLFGYLIQTPEILNPDSLLWSAGIVGGIIILRAAQLKISRLPLVPLVFIAPRGLITILLFLSIEPGQTIPLVNNSLIIQVIIMTALIMMFGLMIRKKEI